MDQKSLQSQVLSHKTCMSGNTSVYACGKVKVNIFTRYFTCIYVFGRHLLKVTDTELKYAFKLRRICTKSSIGRTTAKSESEKRFILPFKG